MKRPILFALFTFGLVAASGILILLSWLPNPILNKLGWLPDGVGTWADHPDNENIRTAVPMLIWGFLAGMILFLKRAEMRWWILSGLTGTVLVAIAELGQIWIPNRHPDFGDIFWGCVGLNTGLLFVKVFIWPGYKSFTKITQ
jgi:peptidoglycan/LPS O-acetylase OafA/YrhL